MSEYPVPVTLDIDEGRYLRIGCLSCHADRRATLQIATPVSMYFIAPCCDECGDQIVVVDQFMGVRRTWRAA